MAKSKQECPTSGYSTNINRECPTSGYSTNKKQECPTSGHFTNNNLECNNSEYSANKSQEYPTSGVSTITKSVAKKQENDKDIEFTFISQSRLAYLEYIEQNMSSIVTNALNKYIEQTAQDKES